MAASEEEAAAEAAAKFAGELVNLTKQVYKYTKMTVDEYAKIQKYETAIGVNLRSTVAAKKAMVDIQNAARETPASVDELANAYINLSRKGIAPTKDEMVNLNDFAIAAGKSYGELTDAIAKGKWDEMGLDAERANGKITLSFQGLRATVDENAAAVTRLIEKFGQAEGIAGNSAILNNTVSGLQDRISENSSQLMATVGGELVKEYGFWGELWNSALEWGNGLTADRQVGPKEKAAGDDATALSALDYQMKIAQNDEERIKLLKEFQSAHKGLLDGLDAEHASRARIQADINKAYDLSNRKQATAQSVDEWDKKKAELEKAKKELAQKSRTFEVDLNRKGGFLDQAAAAGIPDAKALRKGSNKNAAFLAQHYAYGGMMMENQYEGQKNVGQFIANGLFDSHFGSFRNRYVDVQERALELRNLQSKVGTLEGEAAGSLMMTNTRLGGNHLKYNDLNLPNSSAIAIGPALSGPSSSPGTIPTNMAAASPKATYYIDAIQKGNINIFTDSQDSGRTLRQIVQSEIQLAIQKAIGDKNPR